MSASPPRDREAVIMVERLTEWNDDDGIGGPGGGRPRAGPLPKDGCGGARVPGGPADPQPDGRGRGFIGHHVKARATKDGVIASAAKQQISAIAAQQAVVPIAS